MKLAIMQPYFFPYINYFQLIAAVDKFVFYNDVNFIKQGWINRNHLLVNGSEYKFSIPLNSASSFKHISEVEIDSRSYEKWKWKFFKTIEASYSKAPFFKETYELIKTVLDGERKSISDFAASSLTLTSKHLGLNTLFSCSNNAYSNKHLAGEERITDICLKENASSYYNLIGGQDLYSKKTFLDKGITLNFIKSETLTYKQFNFPFINGLSIIDVLMFNPTETINNFLQQYKLI